MDVANELAQYLDDAGFGTAGTDIFVGQMPEDTTGIYIVRLGGEQNEYLPIERPTLVIYVLHTSGSTAITTLENIKRYIHRMFSTETDNAWIYSILAIGDISDVDRDLEYNKIYSLTVELLIRDKNLIS